MAKVQSESPGEILSVIQHASRIVSKLAGIQLGERQYAMVESRLRSRMVKLQLSTLKEYLGYLESNQEQESLALLSLLTTHHTFFFREFNHFEYMLNHVLEPAIERARSRGDKKIRIWSAASSRGQEAYSLAMFMKFHLSAAAPDVDFEIWGTDVDPESVKWAKNGVYKAEELKQAPAMYIENNWVRGEGKVKGFSKVKDHLKSRCKFETANLLSCDQFLSQKSFDIVFCRNVYIYFNPEQIKTVTKKILEHLDEEGFLFLGVSESLSGLGLPVQGSGLSIYRHASHPLPKPETTVQAPQRVLCVDDSPTILALLKKILVKDEGFEVVATAANGQLALDYLKNNKVDIITLDLHMPELDGVGFLKNYQAKDAPVVVLSSVNRDDMSLAQKALSLGASDYVEKPSLENIAQAANEIRSKLKTVLKSKSLAPQAKATVKTYQKTRVLIVDDSQTIQELLEKIINQDPGMEVVGKTGDPYKVDGLIQQTKPDLITLDIHMPGMDGVTLLRQIMPKYGLPVVMISSISREEGPQVLQALELGAIDYIQKPEMKSLGELAPQMRERLKIAAKSRPQKKRGVQRKFTGEISGADSLILIGASTGGTEAIRVVLESFPKSIPPILIVQHIPAGFSAAFAKRLNDLLPFQVKEAVDGELVEANKVLIAPGGLQMGVRSLGGKLAVQVLDAGSVNRHKPSVDYLFQSVSRLGIKNVVGVIMTGMGADGARGLKDLRSGGAKTIAQDEESSVVFGMPKEAIRLGAAETVSSLDKMTENIIAKLNEFKKRLEKRSA